MSVPVGIIVRLCPRLRAMAKMGMPARIRIVYAKKAAVVTTAAFLDSPGTELLKELAHAEFEASLLSFAVIILDEGNAIGDTQIAHG